MKFIKYLVFLGLLSAQCASAQDKIVYDRFVGLEKAKQKLGVFPKLSEGLFPNVKDESITLHGQSGLEGNFEVKGGIPLYCASIDLSDKSFHRRVNLYFSGKSNTWLMEIRYFLMNGKCRNGVAIVEMKTISRKIK
jgi:hypothetical protein